MYRLASPTYLLVYLLSTLAAFADEEIELGYLFDDDMQAWYEISFRCSELVPYFYEKNDQDSLCYILQYWEEETGVMEPVRRAWILNQIAQNLFEPSYLSDIIIEDFIEYLSSYETQESDTSHWIVPGYEKAAQKLYYICADFNQFIRALATELLNYSDLSDDEYLICLFYSHEFDEFHRLIETDAAKYTKLYEQVQRYHIAVEKFDMHYGFFLGYWTPRSSLSLFGDKINVGGVVGAQWQNVIFDCTLLFQFLDSKNPYTVKNEGDLINTTHYFRFYFGVEPAFVLYDWDHTQVHLISGAGIDVVEVVPEDENSFNEESVSIIGPNLNVGIGIRHYLIKGKPYYLQYKLQYEFVGYNSHGGTDLANGEAVSHRLGFYWDANTRKHEFRKYF
ncbi:hypothetical protein JXA02_02385 [candidate division KSB1 bacterium]|nr:hypothetical protein [candidate division KSB1 bacterium]RQW10244.1 MAG: hypothetical protein EH222_02615 [candidate division KSB1 bacterium]